MEQVNLMNYSQMRKDKSVSNVPWTKKKKKYLQIIMHRIIIFI